MYPNNTNKSRDFIYISIDWVLSTDRAIDQNINKCPKKPNQTTEINKEISATKNVKAGKSQNISYINNKNEVEMGRGLVLEGLNNGLHNSVLIQ